MQTCDFVQRNGRCADSCRLWGVSCLKRGDFDWDHTAADLIISFGIVALLAALVVL